MKLYMKQKFWSLKEDFDIYDSQGQAVYRVASKWLTLGRKMKIMDGQTGEAVCQVNQQVIAFTPTMKVYYQGQHFCTIRKKITLFRPKYVVSGLNWRIEGNIFQHDYKIRDHRGHVIVEVRKKFFAWSDTFEFNIKDETIDPVQVVAVILAIDMAMDQAESN